MDITAEDIQDWKENIEAAQSVILDKLAYSVNTTFSLNPDTNPPTDKTTEEYLKEYAVKIVSEIENYREIDEEYRDSLNNAIQNLHMTPTGTVLTEFAKETIMSLKETDKDITTEYTKLVEKLERRRQRANQMAAKENLPAIGSINYNIRPVRTPRLVELRTDFRKQPSENAQNVNAYTIETKKSTPYDNFVKLPVFDGNIEEWSAFYMIFEPTVIKNDSYENVMKHNILRNHLRGEPADLIKPYSTDGTQFDAVIKRLSDRYGSKEKQYVHLWNKLCGIPLARDHPKSLRILHNELYAIINSLKNQGTEIETQNYQVEIKKKLPRSVLVTLLRENPANTTALLEKLDTLISIEEAAQQSMKDTENHDRIVLAVKGSLQNNTCEFCNRKNHSAVECRTVPTLEDRKNFIRDNRLCFLCLGDGHTVRECDHSNCETCEENHNQAICPRNPTIARKKNKENPRHYQNDNYQQKNFSENHQSPDNETGNDESHVNWTMANQRDQDEESQMDQDYGNVQKSQRNWQNKPTNQGQSAPNKNSARNYHVQTNKKSLMIANAPITFSGTIEKTPVLLDTGADRSFILSSFAENKNLKILEKNIKVDFCVFGTETKTIISNRVAFEILINKNTVLTVEALTVPEITKLSEPLTLSSEDENYLKLRNQKLANTTKPEKAIALLGCDVFWELIKDGKKKLPSGKFLIPTQIGNIVCDSNYKNDTNQRTLSTKMRPHNETNRLVKTLDQKIEKHNKMKPVFHVSLHEDNNVYVEIDRKDIKKEEKTCLVGNKTEQRKTENTHDDISFSHFETENNNKEKNHLQVVNNPISLNIQNTVKITKPKPFSDIKIELKSITDNPNQQTLQKINKSSQEKQALVLKKEKLNYRKDTETRLKTNCEDKPMIVCGRAITTTSESFKMTQHPVQERNLANPEKINSVVHLQKMEPFGHYAWPPEADGNNPSYIFFSLFPVYLSLSLSPHFIVSTWPFRKLHSNYFCSQYLFPPLVPFSTGTTTMTTTTFESTNDCPKSKLKHLQLVLEENCKPQQFWNNHRSIIQNLDMDSSAKLPGPECRDCYLRLKEQSYAYASRAWKSHWLDELDLTLKTNATIMRELNVLCNAVSLSPQKKVQPDLHRHRIPDHHRNRTKENQNTG